MQFYTRLKVHNFIKRVINDLCLLFYNNWVLTGGNYRFVCMFVYLDGYFVIQRYVILK